MTFDDICEYCGKRWPPTPEQWRQVRNEYYGLKDEVREMIEESQL